MSCGQETARPPTLFYCSKFCGRREWRKAQTFIAWKFEQFSVRWSFSLCLYNSFLGPKCKAETSTSHILKKRNAVQDRHSPPSVQNYFHTFPSRPVRRVSKSHQIINFAVCFCTNGRLQIGGKETDRFCAVYFSYEGRSEGKERLRIQPAQLLPCTRWVIYCVQ